MDVVQQGKEIEIEDEIAINTGILIVYVAFIPILSFFPGMFWICGALLFGSIKTWQQVPFQRSL